MKVWWYAFKHHHPIVYYILKGWSWLLLLPFIFTVLMGIGWVTEEFFQHWIDFSAEPKLGTLLFGLAGIGFTDCFFLIVAIGVFIGIPLAIGYNNYQFVTEKGPLNALIQSDRAAQKQPQFQRWIKKYQMQSDTEGYLYQIPAELVKDLTQSRYQEPFVVVKVYNPTPLPDGTKEEFYLQVPGDKAITTAKEAVAWTFSKSGKDYKPVQRA